MKLIDEIAALRPKVYNIAMKLTRKRSDAEDLVQEVMAHAIKNKSKYKEGTLVGWLSVLTYRQFINSKRARQYSCMDVPVLETFMVPQPANQEDAVYACEVLRFMKSNFTPLQYDAMIPGQGNRFEPNPQNVTTRRNRGREKLANWLEAA